MTILHTITSELTSDPEQYTLLPAWIASKIGDERATAMTTTNDGSNITEEFSNFYDAWLYDQKITHVVEIEGEPIKVISYKDLPAERVAFVNAHLV